MVFSNDDTARPFLTNDHKMWLFFEPSLGQRLAHLDKAASTVESVRGTLLEVMPAGAVDATGRPTACGQFAYTSAREGQLPANDQCAPQVACASLSAQYRQVERWNSFPDGF
jgi:hypothetical protein